MSDIGAGKVEIRLKIYAETTSKNPYAAILFYIYYI